MSLATDILKKAGLNLVADKKRLKYKDRIKAREIHTVRVRGLYWRDGWETSVQFGNTQRSVGTFDSAKRALLAIKLWNYWRSTGINPSYIPTKPKIYEPRRIL